jgi:hypothetical protein
VDELFHFSGSAFRSPQATLSAFRKRTCILRHRTMRAA